MILKIDIKNNLGKISHMTSGNIQNDKTDMLYYFLDTRSGIVWNVRWNKFDVIIEAVISILIKYLDV